LIKSANEKDTWKVSYDDENLFTQELLFYSEIVKVLEPDSLRKIVISALEVASE
jgi:predicted DNA-binding transcriptional regulator YafY